MQPGNPPQGPPPRIDNNMTMTIVSFLLFWPLAIPALVHALKVNTALEQGDYAGAQVAAAESRRWSKLAVIIGAALYGLLVLCVLGIVAAVLLAGGDPASGGR